MLPSGSVGRSAVSHHNITYPADLDLSSGEVGRNGGKVGGDGAKGGGQKQAGMGRSDPRKKWKQQQQQCQFPNTVTPFLGLILLLQSRIQQNNCHRFK